jgi:hypothetical protein
MKKVFFDTSILSRIAWSQKNEPLEKIRDKWDFFLGKIDSIYPGFSEENIELISSHATYLEIIGFGAIRKRNSIKNSVFTKKPIKALSHLVIKDEWKQHTNPENFIQDVADRVNKFIKNELSPRNLYRQTLNFLRSYPSHPQSHFIVANVKHWSKNIKNEPEFYALFQAAFFWDSIFRYPFINIDTIAVPDHEKAMHIWAKVMGTLFREYYKQYTENVSLECSSLGFFAEIDRIGSFHNGIAKQRGYKDILRRWDDMADVDSIHYALVGKRITLKINEPIIVVTGDKREDIEQRLECLYKNLQEMTAKGLPINTCLGTIIPFSLETMEINGNPIDVRDFIKKLGSI